jgi:GNAT superfamily N-acetyltransferase
MPTKTSRLVFRETSVADALAAGIEDLAEANYTEVELLQQEFPFKPNWPSFQMAERRGEFFGLGAFCKGDLVGYAGYSLYVPDHHQGALWAFNRVVYMAPAHRGWGSLELMDKGTGMARDKGAQAVVQAVKEPNSTDGKRSASLCSLLLRKGFLPYERTFVKVL